MGTTEKIAHLADDPALELFTLRLKLAEERDRVASLEADVQVYSAMVKTGYDAVATLTKQRDALQARVRALINELQEMRGASPYSEAA